MSVFGKIVILEAFRDAVRSVSPRLYNSVQHRDEVYAAIIEALEKLYQEEEFEEDKVSLEKDKKHLTQPDVEPENIAQAHPTKKAEVFYKTFSKEKEKSTSKNDIKLDKAG
jgi:hypothetical protein